jgi:hypothetical protein
MRVYVRMWWYWLESEDGETRRVACTEVWRKVENKFLKKGSFVG